MNFTAIVLSAGKGATGIEVPAGVLQALDTAPREVVVPADLAAALAGSPAAKATFEALSNSGKKRHTLSIEGAKTDETRQRRVAKAISDLEAGA